jgi:hypothetical protein
VTDGGSGGTHDSGAVAQIDAGADAGSETITLTADSFTVAPGAEVYKCQAFPNPFGGAADIVWMDGEMSAGSHHFFLFNLGPGEAPLYSTTLADCPGAGLEFHPFPYLSQQPSWTVAFPKDANGLPMGYPFVSGNTLMINVHYLNASANPIQAKVSIKIQAYRPGVVKTHVGSLFLNQTTMSAPPGLSDPQGVWGGNPLAASADGSYTIYSSWSHMHQWGTQFTATTNGQPFYKESNWDSPGLFWHMTPPPGTSNPSTASGQTTPVKMTATQSITWDCQYNNTTGATLTFGDSARSNVMCIYIGQYYPASATNPDVVYVFN